ncbi:nitrilase-related carbon-nitrogen hydrolase [Proteinivorax tanatarense]|uniref:Nitrilase-related carbon-nitrogen hydrolase n=1 Tax=Proteinivorax tanatarense TaxID=1260629 RepID=A0AAU7VPL8_9FIRM
MTSARVLRYLLEKKLNTNLIDQYYDKLPALDEIRISDQTNLKVSCIQREVILVKDIKDYLDMANSFVKIAVKEGSDLVVFPEYNFFDLFGLIPGTKKINNYINKKNTSSDLTDKNGTAEFKGRNYLKNILAVTAKPISKAIRKIYSQLANHYGIYIYTGTFIENRGGVLYNTGSLFDNKGNLIGNQDKIHLTEFEEQIGITRANQLNIHNLPWGKLAFPICMDATYYETFQIAKEYEADFVIVPIANMEEYSMWRALRGVWPRVQESYVYGLKSSLNGWIFGVHFTGKAGIFAPLSITAKKDGVIALAPNYEGNYVVTSELVLSNLYEARENDEYFGDKNHCFEKEYIKNTYL